LQAWELAKKGDPQNLLLVADTGWGKTRLMQWLYETLAGGAANNGYWPAEIDASGDLRRQKVNPTLTDHAASRSIPYLWLAMRGVEDRTALTEALEALRPHTIALLAHWAYQLGQRDLDRQAWSDLIELGAEVTGLGTLRLVAEKARNVLRREQMRREPAPRLGSLDDNANRARQEWLENLVDLVAAFLAPGDERLPTLPVVLFLDDAQWADEAALALVEKLILRARANRWPLLTVAAHWKKDLPPDYQTERSSFANWPERLADMLDAELQPMGWDRIELGEETGLSEAATDLPPDQAQEIAKMAGGHPLRFVGLLKLCRLHPTWMRDGRLTDHAMAELRKADTMNALATQIFDALTDELRAMLGWASRAGRRFLHRIVAEMAADAGWTPSIPHEAFEETLGEAGRRSGYTEKVSGEAISAFTQADFHVVARRFFDRGDPQALAETVAALRRGLGQALAADVFDRLSAAEQEDALDLALAEFRPEGDVAPASPDWARWGRAAFAKLARLEATYRFSAAEELALALGAAGAWPTTVASVWEQCVAARRLLKHQEREAALRWLVGLRGIAANAWDRMIVLTAVGDAYVAGQQWGEALAAYEEGKSIAEEIVRRFGREYQPLRDLSVSWERVGDVHAAQQRWGEALAAYEEGKSIAKEIVNRFGREYRPLRDLAVSWERVANVHAAQQRWGEALAAYEEGKAIAEEIMDRFGREYEPLRDLAVSWSKVGDVYAAGQQWAKALDAYERGKAIAEEIVERFGQQYESIRGLSVSRERVGNVHAAQQRWGEALAAYEEDKTIAEEIVDRFGRQYEPLRDLWVSLNKVGDGHAAEHQWGEAMAAYEEAKTIAEEIVDRFGREYQPLRDLSVSWERVGDGHAAQQLWGEALAAYEEGKTIAEEIVERFGREYQPLRDLFVSVAKIGVRSGSCEELRGARDLSDEILRRFPGSEEARKDRSWLDGVKADLGG
jgi:tetratricopeptide (TPR) repeat protein